MAEFDPRRDGIDFLNPSKSPDERLSKYLQMIEKFENRFSSQEAGRITYRLRTADKDGLMFELNSLREIVRNGFKEMEQEEK